MEDQLFVFKGHCSFTITRVEQGCQTELNVLISIHCTFNTIKTLLFYLALTLRAEDV